MSKLFSFLAPNETDTVGNPKQKQTNITREHRHTTFLFINRKSLAWIFRVN